jgi:hypothetical protein
MLIRLKITNFLLKKNKIILPLYLILSFLPLGATARGKLWPPEQSASIQG